MEAVLNSDIEKNRLIDDVAKFLSQFAYQLKCETLDVLEYIKIEDDHPTGDNLTDEDIIALVKSTRKDLEIEEEVEIKKTEELKVITHKEALASYENLFNYLENKTDFNSKDLDLLLALKHKLDMVNNLNQVQTKLDKFIIN